MLVRPVGFGAPKGRNRPAWGNAPGKRRAPRRGSPARAQQACWFIPLFRPFRARWLRDRVVLGVELHAMEGNRVAWTGSAKVDAVGDGRESAMARYVSLPLACGVAEILDGGMMPGFHSCWLNSRSNSILDPLKRRLRSIYKPRRRRTLIAHSQQRGNISCPIFFLGTQIRE